MRKGLTVILLLMLSIAGKAQTMSQADIEKKSYAFFMLAEWDSVIHVVNQAHAQGIDYYYLQARLGTAYMAKKNYRKAEKAFAKALQFNKSDYAQENLYYALLYSGDVDAARKVYSQSLPVVQERLDVKKIRALDFINAEGGVKASTDDPPIGNISYGALGLSHKLGHSFSLFHNFSYLKQDKYNATLTQAGYSIIPKYQFSRAMSATAAFHYMNSTFADTTYNDWAMAATLKFRASNFDLIPLQFALSSLNEEQQMQLGVALGWYPFGNPNLSTLTTFNMHLTPNRNYPVIKQSITGKVFKYLWLTGEIVKDDEIVRFFGDVPLTVNNSLDINNFQYSIIGSIPFSQKFSLYGMFMKENKDLSNTTLQYKFNTFIIGLKYNL